VHSCSGLYAYQEHEAKLPDLHFVATVEPLIIDPNPVHVRSVQAAHVPHTPTVGTPTEFCVSAADGYVV
jgi:hypothetical protein